MKQIGASYFCIETGVTSRARPGSGDEAKPGGWWLARDVRVEAHRFALDAMVHERLPLVNASARRKPGRATLGI